jgi:hypothetical protein
MKDLKPIRAIVACCVCVMLACGTLRGQVKTISLTVKGPRPLADMAQQLERLSGVPISFEDVRYENASDVEDVTESVVKPQYRAPNRTAAPIRVLSPRGGELSLSLEVEAGGTNRPRDLHTALTGALDAYAAKGFPGRYAVKQDGGIFIISPAGVRDAGGSMIPAKSILEALVTFAPVPRSAAETLELILAEVSRTSGFQVDVGTIPLNGFIPRIVTVGAWREPAKSVLLRLFANVALAKTATGESATVLSYRLFFDPGLRCYALNIHVVRPLTQAAAEGAPAARAPTTSDRFFAPTVRK